MASLLLRGRIHRALVMEAGKLVGIVTSVDVLRAVAEDGLEATDSLEGKTAMDSIK